MKKFFLIISFLTLSSFAQESGFGLGIIAGIPTGFSGKLVLSEVISLNVGLGYSFSGSNEKVHLYVDYVWNNKDYFEQPNSFSLYYGIGGRVKTFDLGDNVMGIRGVAGLIFVPNDSKFEFFLETAPAINIVPKSNLDFDGALGVRYFF